MAVSTRQAVPSVGLIFEPDPPAEGLRAHGWRAPRAYSGGDIERNPDHDEYGAMIQRVIACYMLTRATRGELAARIGASERAITAWLVGDAWAAYATPVLRALARLGVGEGRGNWRNGGDRNDEVIAAGRQVMARALRAIEGEPLSERERAELLADLRLLLAGDDGAAP